MKRQKLMIAGVILALSIFGSANCFAGDEKLLIDLFGQKAAVIDPRTKELLEQQALWDQQHPHVPTARELAEQKEFREQKLEADRESQRKKVELAAQGLWKEPVMASDQGEKATQTFIDTLFGNNGAAGAITNAAKAAVTDVRDHAKEAAKDAASDSRDSVRPATDGIKDNCKNSMPMGH